MENIYMNRELSWLKFNERVLEEAENNEVPLCERMNFVSIYQSNLDEFFRVRVGSLQDQMLVNKKIRDNKTKMTSEEQIKIRKALDNLFRLFKDERLVELSLEDRKVIVGIDEILDIPSRYREEYMMLLTIPAGPPVIFQQCA